MHSAFGVDHGEISKARDRKKGAATGAAAGGAAGAALGAFNEHGIQAEMTGEPLRPWKENKIRRHEGLKPMSGVKQAKFVGRKAGRMGVAGAAYGATAGLLGAGAGAAIGRKKKS